MVDIIAAAREPLEGWVFVVSNGIRMVGRPVGLMSLDGLTAPAVEFTIQQYGERSFWLKPAYELQQRFFILPQGQQAPPVVLPNGNAVGTVPPHALHREGLCSRGCDRDPDGGVERRGSAGHRERH